MKTILLADDSITIQKVVELTFSEADYRVICVSNGSQALKKVAETRPDVVLLDVIMPEMNGYEVCEALKRNPATSGIPVLLLTGTFEPFDKRRAETAGANGHLTKPFESQALVRKVEELIASTPSVAADEAGGRMDIISGGEVYRVDPSRPAEGMRPVTPPAAALAPASEVGEAATEPAPPYPPSVPEPSRSADEEEGATHPALAPPDPAAGGSYVGFADIGFDGGMENEIVPDRFDEREAASPSTVRLRREELLPGREAAVPGTGAPGAGGGSSPSAEPAFSGSFEAEFDLVDEPGPEPSIPEAPAAETGGWAPPPEAPPAETWQDVGGVPRQDAQVPPGVGAFEGEAASPGPSVPHGGAPAPASDGRAVALTSEMIDLIAEKVVERLADRVVREVAWEVVPGVAEALVRKRIKELEESGS